MLYELMILILYNIICKKLRCVYIIKAFSVGKKQIIISVLPVKEHVKL